MVVLVLEKCPTRVRGYVSRWLYEVSTNVFVGDISITVRKALWETVTNNVFDGRCILVYSSSNEQGWAVQSHNVLGRFADFDGLVLPMKPSALWLTASASHEKRKNIGYQGEKKPAINSQKKNFEIPQTYVSVDIETTGLNYKKDEILEVAAIRVQDGVVVESFCELIAGKKRIPKTVKRMTGITDEMRIQCGQPAEEALRALQGFISQDILIGYNIAFDMQFLNRALFRVNGQVFNNRTIDVLTLAKKYMPQMESYKLGSLCDMLDIEYTTTHRASADASLCNQIFQQLSVLTT